MGKQEGKRGLSVDPGMVPGDRGEKDSSRVGHQAARRLFAHRVRRLQGGTSRAEAGAPHRQYRPHAPTGNASPGTPARVPGRGPELLGGEGEGQSPRDLPAELRGEDVASEGPTHSLEAVFRRGLWYRAPALG